MHADKTHRNYNGHFVYPEDAEDLKAHPFFMGIPWDSMQQYNPPFVPRVKSWEDTKYFDDEGPVSDLDTATSEEETFRPLELENNPPRASCHQQEAQNIVPETPPVERGLVPNPLVAPNSKKGKEKRRPRDKVLRDVTCGKMALSMRKNDAFKGYSYHRSKSISEVIEEILADEGVLYESDFLIGRE